MKESDSPIIKRKKHEARMNSIKEGIFCSTKVSLGDRFVSPLAIAINASSPIVALLTSITGLLGPLSQTFGSKLLEKYQRKKIVTKTAFIESLSWIPFIIIAILFYKGIITEILPLILLLSFAFYTIACNLAHPAWFSWMGDIVSKKNRGQWFSKRNLIIGFISIIIAILASIFLDYSKTNNWTMFGFAILFFLALIARIISWKILKKQYEPKAKLEKSSYHSFFEFVLRAPKNNFGRFTIFRSLIGFTSSISSPLLAVYLLRNLNFSYTEYIIIILGGTFVSLFVLELWGKFADRYGNYKTIIVSCILIPIIPILWILHPSMHYLLLIPSLISGAAWAGLHLAAVNFIYDNISDEKRGHAVSYYNMLWGIGVFLGAGIGALLIKFLNTSFIEPIIAIFIISAITRAIVAIWWLPKFKEVRRTSKFTTQKALKYMILKYAAPILMEEFHQIVSIKKYLRTK